MSTHPLRPAPDHAPRPRDLSNLHHAMVPFLPPHDACVLEAGGGDVKYRQFGVPAQRP